MINTYNIIENNITYSVKEYANGDKFWYLNGKFHRVNGPAVELANGSNFWYLNHQLHRTDGPAIEYADGYKHWYYYDTEIICNNLKEFTKQIKLLSIS